MSRKPRKQYDDDDGRTIANMNVDGMPWYRPWKRESPDGMTPQTSSAGGKKRRESVKLTREESRAVTWGVRIKNVVKLTCRGVICAELHSVIADNIYGVAVHLTEYAAAHPRADHQKLVLCAQCVQHTEIGLGKLRLVLSERAVKVKRDQSYIIHILFCLSYMNFSSARGFNVRFPTL